MIQTDNPMIIFICSGCVFVRCIPSFRWNLSLLQVSGVLLSSRCRLLAGVHPACASGLDGNEGSDTYVEGSGRSHTSRQEVQRRSVCDDRSGLGQRYTPDLNEGCVCHVLWSLITLIHLCAVFHFFSSDIQRFVASGCDSILGLTF